ncbi:MAG: hypothetical protein HYZ58_14705 [Acidobacteria bacterium]|nr:hypothetical protein [Acidobacteriota bacterium]
MQGSLDTTNLLLGILAAVSVLEALALGLAAYVGHGAYRHMMRALEDIQERQITPVVARVNAILDDVKEISGRVSEETERVDQAIHRALDRVDETTGRVRTNVHLRTSRVVGIVRGIRAALETFLSDDDVSHHRQAATTRVM